MSRLLTLLTVLACLVSSPVLAIDCAKANQDFEKAICADPKLVTADAELSRFYFERLKGLTGEAHDLLQADQRHWVEMRGANCRPLTAECLPKDIAARRRAIAVCTRSPGSLADDPNNEVECLYHHHGGCPSLSASGSANLVRYAFLFDRLVSGMKRQSDMFDCVPDPDQSSPRTNVADSSHEIVSFSNLFNGVTAESPIYDSLLHSIEGKLDVPCCGDDAKDTGGTLEDLHLERVLP